MEKRFLAKSFYHFMDSLKILMKNNLRLCVQPCGIYIHIYKYICRSGVFIVNFEHISHLDLVFLIVNFEQVNTGWNIHTQLHVLV